MKSVKITIDPAGRLVLPKRVRERFRLRAGAQLELEVESDHLRLRPVNTIGPALFDEGGWWVHCGEPEGAVDLEDAVDRHRRERIEDLSR